MADATISMQRLMRNVTLTVRLTGHRQFVVRQWIAVRLLALAALVLGCQIDVQTGAVDDVEGSR